MHMQAMLFPTITMKHISTTNRSGFFLPLIQSGSVQSAIMVLKPGQSSSDEPENEHPRAEQWLFVIDGSGRASVNGRNIALKTGSLLLIAKNERHQITNTGRKPLRTVNFYAPPAYTKDGGVKASIRK
jgi:mannose-6-phosphate isomerase-like protein (cupin superfamily)